MLGSGPNTDKLRQWTLKLFNRCTTQITWADWGWANPEIRKRHLDGRQVGVRQQAGHPRPLYYLPRLAELCRRPSKPLAQDPPALRKRLLEQVAEVTEATSKFHFTEYDVTNELRELKEITSLLGRDAGGRVVQGCPPTRPELADGPQREHDPHPRRRDAGRTGQLRGVDSVPHRTRARAPTSSACRAISAKRSPARKRSFAFWTGLRSSARRSRSPSSRWTPATNRAKPATCAISSRPSSATPRPMRLRCGDSGRARCGCLRRRWSARTGRSNPAGRHGSTWC